MKTILLDTSILVRERDTQDPNHSVTVEAIRKLGLSGWQMYVTTQTLIEYWAVATRPATLRGGLGLSPQVAENDLSLFLSIHDFLEEPQGIFLRWRTIVNQYQVSGRQVWDARLAAVADLAGIPHLLTFNQQDFSRYRFLQVWSPDEIENLLHSET